jgi:hypothetical protein
MVVVVQVQLLSKICVNQLMKKLLIIGLLAIVWPLSIFAQHTVENLKQLNFFQDSLKHLGNTFINAEIDIDRKVANYQFIKTLVTALKIPNSFLYPFDSVKTISILNSPDNRFRIFSWYILNMDGSYRFYGAIQMNTGGSLKLYPLEDYSPILKNPEDSLTDNHKWYGAQYYKIIHINTGSPYYVLLGWKGNTVESTKKVIEVVSFKTSGVQFGLPVFEQKGRIHKRMVFEYARDASMLLRYVPDQNLIVFDNLAPPDKKSKDKPQTYGPDLSYDGFRLKNGRWEFIENLDMRNIPSEKDAKYNDPKTAKVWDKTTKPDN